MDFVNLKIIGKRYTIETVDASILQDLGGVDGVTLASAGKIKISDGMSEDDRLETVLHELLHAIWAGMDVGFSDRTEEKVVTALSKGLRAVIVDNDREITEGIFYGDQT